MRFRLQRGAPHVLGNVMLEAITLVPAAKLSWHTAVIGTHVWARKLERGVWHPAVVIRVGQLVAHIRFENGRRSSQLYSECFLRNPRKHGADKPARVQQP